MTALLHQLAAVAFPALVAALVTLALTPVVERFKRKSWAAQELWKLKVSLYERLLLNLDALHNLTEPDYSTSPPSFDGELTESGDKALREALSNVENAAALAALWLPSETTKALNNIRVMEIYSDPHDWRERLFNAAEHARTLVLKTVRADLAV